SAAVGVSRMEKHASVRWQRNQHLGAGLMDGTPAEVVCDNLAKPIGHQVIADSITQVGRSDHGRTVAVALRDPDIVGSNGKPASRFDVGVAPVMRVGVDRDFYTRLERSSVIRAARLGDGEYILHAHEVANETVDRGSVQIVSRTFLKDSSLIHKA